MPTVPQYTREVKPELTPNKYFKPELNTDMFGVNVARAQGNLGNAIGNVGDSLNNAMLGIAARIEDANILGLRNHSSEYCEKNLTDLQNGYLYKTGEDAYGKSEALVKDYEKYMTDYISKSFATPRAKKKAMDTYAVLKDRFVETVTKHDYNQGIEMARYKAEDTKSHIIGEAILYRNDKDEYNKLLQTGFQAIEFQGEVSHWDDSQINSEKRKYLARVTESTLEQFIKDRDLKAREFFEENKKAITPEKLPAYSEAVKRNEIEYYARDNAAKLQGLSYEQAIGEINKIKDIPTRDATEREYNRQARQAEDIKKENEKQMLEGFYNTVYSKMQSGEDVTFDDIPAGLDADTKVGLTRFINSKGNPKTDESVWDDLYYKSVNDAQGFVELDLNKYRGYLSDGEYKSFVKRQEDIKSGKFYTQIKDDNELIEAALDACGLSGGIIRKHKKTKDTFYSEARALVREFESRKGREATDEEVQNLINSLGYKDDKGVMLYKQIEKGMGERNGFIRDVMNDFVYYQSQHNGQMPPDEEKAKIINRRASSVIIKQNNEMTTSLRQPYVAKEGDFWQGHKITSVYGKRTSPTTNATTDHKGVDLAYNNNEPFVAYASGVVVNTGNDSKLGKFVDIKSPDGIIHRYGHANAILVNVGTPVKAGQMIGKAGSTGVATGPHVHYAKIKNGQFINPLDDGMSDKLANSGKGWAF